MRKRFIGMLMLVAILFLVTSAMAGPIKYTVAGYPAAISENLLDKAIDYAVAGDRAAMQQLLNSGLVIMLKGGIKVEMVKLKLFRGRVKIRPFGTTLEVWTVIEAVK